MSNISVQRLGLFLVMGMGIIFAWIAGNSIADQEYSVPVIVIGVVALGAVYFGLGKKIYLLIPVCSGLTGQIPLLPLPFNAFQLLILASTAHFIIDIIFKREKKIESNGLVNFWIWINLIYLGTVFVRNPVSVAALNFGNRVGGLPYLNVIIGLLAYLILRRLSISPGFSRKMPIYVLAISAFNAIAGAVATFLPEIGFSLGNVYSGFIPHMLEQGEIVAGESRFTFLPALGTTLILYLVSKTNPLSFINVRHIGSLVLYFTGVAMIFLSGFRNSIISSILYTILAAFVRERFVGAVKVLFSIGIIAVCAILFSYTNIQLPFTAQRALCFLPGKWDAEAVADAKGSSEWRFEIWEIALTTPKYIHNKILGDGFGFERSDFERARDIEAGLIKLREDELRQEMFLLNGDYHSGPVSAIRFVGLVGLLILLPLLMLFAVTAFRLITRSLGSKFEFCCLFYCIPMVIYPFFFIFIFGDYKSVLVDIMIGFGVMQMLTNSINRS